MCAGSLLRQSRWVWCRCQQRRMCGIVLPAFAFDRRPADTHDAVCPAHTRIHATARCVATPLPEPRQVHVRFDAAAAAAACSLSRFALVCAARAQNDLRRRSRGSRSGRTTGQHTVRALQALAVAADAWSWQAHSSHGTCPPCRRSLAPRFARAAVTFAVSPDDVKVWVCQLWSKHHTRKTGERGGLDTTASGRHHSREAGGAAAPAATLRCSPGGILDNNLEPKQR
jgi:hypothetical protein